MFNTTHCTAAELPAVLKALLPHRRRSLKLRLTMAYAEDAPKPTCGTLLAHPAVQIAAALAQQQGYALVGCREAWFGHIRAGSHAYPDGDVVTYDGHVTFVLKFKRTGARKGSLLLCSIKSASAKSVDRLPRRGRARSPWFLRSFPLC